MTRFRIYTESRGNLPKLAGAYFDGFTLFRGLGFWEGNSEQSTVIEILADKAERWKVDLLVKDILSWNQQDAVLVTSEDIPVELITRKEAQ